MTHEIPDSEPTRIEAGVNWQWDRTLSDHPPSDGWTLKYTLRGPTDKDFTAGTTGETYEIRVAPSVTEGIDAGTYRLTGYVEKGSDPVTDREIVYSETLEVVASPITAVNSKSHAETVYEAVKAVLEGSATKEQRRVSINGRELERWSPSELIRLRNVYADQVRMERNPGQLSPGIEARFGAP